MAEEPSTLEPGTVLAGRYRVEHRLGEGGMGSVYLVQHMHTDQRLALKVLHATVVKDTVHLERFRREARAPARVQSDHVVQVTDADVAPELGGVPFLVMEWLRGEDLEKVSARGPMPRQDVVLYLRQAARALDKAHAIGIVHRDLKPENLFLTTREDGAPWIKLLDFGIAKLTGPAGDVATTGSTTSTGQIFGTPLYMSPEQVKAETEKVAPQTDIWALGLIAHKLLAGKEIWSAQTLTHLIAQIAYDPMPVPSDRGYNFGPAYDAWFLKCCARDPKARYASAGEAVTALAEALGVNEAAAFTLASDARSSRVSVSSPSLETRDKGSEAIALAETAAHDSGQLAAGVSAASTGSSADVPVAAALAPPERPSRARVAAGAAAAAVLFGALGFWLAAGRAPGPAHDEAPTTQGAPSHGDEKAPGGIEQTGVATSPSSAPGASGVDSTAAATPPPPLVAPASPVPPTSTTASTFGKPLATRSPSAAPTASATASAAPSSEAPPAETPPPASTPAPPPQPPEDPLSTRH